MTTRFIGSGRHQEGGALVTRKSDFNVHVNGGDFRHTASMVDMSPALFGSGGVTVQQTLETLNATIASSGSGFVSIGRTDGYTQGSYNVGAVGIPSLAAAFAAAVTNPRLVNGGVILLLAGTYTISSTITIPAGISVIGEIEGTLIIGEMIEQPMFLIAKGTKDVTIGGDTGGGGTKIDRGSNIDSVRFFNLMLADNINANVASGNSSMITVPMIQCQVSSNFSCERVSFIGRLANGAISGRAKTLAAIGYTTGGGTGTTLTVKNCFIDGVKTGIDFNPNNGNIDNLVVDGCRGRFWGTESGVTTQSLNSFIVSSLCNTTLTNNFVVGAGSQANTFWTLTTSGGATAVDIVVMGNTGSPNGTSNTLIHNGTGVTFTSAVTGNNWGNAIDSAWHIVVGGSSGDAPMGDIYGSGAIDKAITLSANSGISSTVIVNPGTYTVTGTSNTFANISLIGNKKGSSYPIVNLNLTSSATDSFGQRSIALGNHIEGIHFVSTGGTIDSLRPGFNPTSANAGTAAHTMMIKDCIFTDVCVHALDIGAGPFTDSLGNTAKLAIVIEDCSFQQTAAFDDNISLVLPRANLINLRNLNFYGTGYAAAIGKQSYSAAAINDAVYTFDNVVMDLTGKTISSESPLGSSFNFYFVINDELARVEMNNCSIVTSNTFVQTTPIDSGLDTEFTRFCSIQCRELIINDSTFCGPNQTYVASAVTYAMPTLWVEVRETCKIDKCRFLSGNLALQLSGSNCFANSTNRDALIVTNSHFRSDASSCLTMIDVDLNLSSSGSYTGQIIIKDNVFFSNPSSNIQVQHVNATGAFHTGQGIVQIYANFFNVIMEGNKIAGTLRAPSTNPYSHFSDIVVNNYDSSSGAGSVINTTKISNNSLDCTNLFTSATAAQSSTNLWIKGSVLNIHDNHFSFSSSASISGSFQGNLWIDNRPTSSGTYSSGNVSQNNFSRRGTIGTAIQLARGYVHIDINSGRGFIIDNFFSDATYDNNAAHTTLVEDQTVQPSKWMIHRNRNQTETINIRAWSGRVATDGTLGKPITGGDPNTSLEAVMSNADPSSYTFTLNYDGTATGNFAWVLPIQTLLPHGVRIISVTCLATCDNNLTKGTFTFSLSGNGLTTQNGSSAIDFTGSYVPDAIITSTITPVNSSAVTTFENIPGNGIVLTLSCISNLLVGGITNGGVAAVINISAMTIVYRW